LRKKYYFKIGEKLVPCIYGGMPYTPVDFSLPLKRESLPDDRDVNIISSTDYFYGVLALGEGPIYDINPNGPQDMEFNDTSLDDLIDFTTNTFDNTKVAAFTVLGNPTLKGVPRDFNTYFGRVSTPQYMSSPVQLRYGNITGIPKTSITQETSASNWDALDFSFTINSLFQTDDEGNFNPFTVGIKIYIYNKSTSNLLGEIAGQFTNPLEITKTGNVQNPVKFQVKVVIPAAYKSSDGYRFTIEKNTFDYNPESKISESIIFNGWEEIRHSRVWYPRTALLGLVLRSYAEYSGSIPVITSLIKGLLVKVPSNYNQPILENDQIDWRELEVPRGDENVSGDLRETYRQYSYPICGYRLESSGSAVQNDRNPIIYKGIWDGTFVKKWTQNPVWIVYDLLTNTSYGLGIPEEYIDKFKFYKVAEYCDAVDSTTGRYQGVVGYADGTFRYKPRGYTRQNVGGLSVDAIKKIVYTENQIGLPAGTQVRERRFICNISITTQAPVMDIINQITAIFRGILIQTGGKISLNVDLPDELPVAVFNETNIIKDTFQITGIKESEILSGVDVSYLDPTNHYKRETVRVDDPAIYQEVAYTKSVDLAGCDRRSQAMRFGQYLLASSKYIRRKVNFKTTSEAVNLSIGDIISVAQKMSGVSWGYGGRVAANTATSGATHLYSNVLLEHFTTPALSSTIMTANTNPIALRIINRQSDKVNLYLVNNSIYRFVASGNATAGVDLAEIKVINRLNPETKLFESITRFDSNAVPIKNDLWSLGEVNPSSYLTSTSDKLFKVVVLEKGDDGLVNIQATEYISNVYVDSDSLINYSPVRFPKSVSPIQEPPPMTLNLKEEPIVNRDGSLGYNIIVDTGTDLSIYPFPIESEILIAKPDDIVIIEDFS